MEEDFKKSGFNEANLKMTRIHELQRIINFAALDKLNIFVSPQDINLGYIINRRNYEVIFEAVSQLLQEVYPKLTPNEMKEINSLRKQIKEFMYSKPVHKKQLNIRKEQEVVFDNSAWRILEDLLFDYDTKVRIYLDVHELSSFDKESDEGL